MSSRSPVLPRRLRTKWLPSLALSCIGLAMPVGLSVLLGPGVAVAQANPFSGQVIELMPGGDVIADGETETVLTFVAYRRNGQPVRGLSGKVSGELGKSAIAEVSPGVYQATVRPNAVTVRGKAKVMLKGKTQAGPFELAVQAHIFLNKRGK